ncbi:alpha-D-xyloside xylohydrolase [Filimonas lacunae]|uniref:Alpha-D-xyloside xylohydrolase n=1 Tax=Filimonas lacunae TaxID=477680 RepID=A0A173MPZ1_9BACT|nr:TIM-barrel domain-containing protein [Filimonas lacunae]BAV09557.1 alpha-xylosidase [Filimonas lacunae]SIS75175.1 alpha-D-xyloside xylohydrolase [Filimonas lacunae]
MIVLSMKKAALCAWCCLLVHIPVLLFAHHTPYSKDADGVVVRFAPGKAGQTRLLQLRVVTDKIIQVKASPDTAFSPLKSLMAISRSDKPAALWTTREEGDWLILKTAAITARLSLVTGELQFADNNGHILLQEKKTGGKAYAAHTADGEKVYAVTQTFLQQEGEAMYGLGGNQCGFVNLRNKPVDVTQYNSVATIPFMVSTAGYGLLWDNYSVSRFGDYRELRPLSDFTLYNAEGKPGGLTAIYNYKDSVKYNTAIQREENNINYDFLDDMNRLPANYKAGKGVVTWVGALQSSATGIHQFLCKASGYTKLYINDSLIMDKWRQPWNPGTTAFELWMNKGAHYKVRLEWVPDGDESFQVLRFLPPVAEQDKNQFGFWSEAADQIEYYFIYGRNADDIISGYRNITGKASLLPKWALGLWQSRERYHSQEEILTTVNEFRKRQIPLDNIVMDWQYWRPDQWGSHEFDTSRFPDAAGMITQLHQQYNTRFMISVWPKFYTGTDNYNLLNSKGWLYTKNIENNQKDWIGYVSTFYDAFNADARKLFWKLMNDKLYTKKVDAWWLDATEPDIYSNISIEQRKALMKPMAIGTPTRYFNTYPLLNAAGVYEGQRSVNANNRVCILTRSAWAGIQRYAAAVWSGDIAARWHDMKDQIASGISFSLAGVPYWSMDIGGFAVEKRYEKATGSDLDEWREQTTRWYQFGAFCPLFRVHGQYPFREIYNVAPETHPAYKSMLYYDQLRYRLLPYIYTLAGTTWQNDYTIMRGLVMDYAADKKARDVADEYMFGPSLLINPVTAYKARSRQVYLPEGNGWYDFYTGAFYKGGQTVEAKAEYERIPVFVKQGAILPVGPVMQYSTEKPADSVTVWVYTGKDGSFTLYEDENLNNNYEKGAYTNIPFTYNEKNGTLEIGDRKGAFTGMLTNRTFLVKWVTPTNDAGIDNSTGKVQPVTYTGKKITIKMK